MVVQADVEQRVRPKSGGTETGGGSCVQGLEAGAGAVAVAVAGAVMVLTFH